MQLTVEDRQALFALIRETMRAHLLKEPEPGLPSGSPAMTAPCGAFVTLRMKADHALRGCIGHTISDEPLVETIRTLAVSSAFRDRRFPPVKMSELAKIKAEISVLSPLAPADPQAVEVGKHGLMISHRGRAGLLLPEVASDRDWTPEEFLQHTCLKAGLPTDAWQHPDAELLWFTSDHYEE